MNLLPTFTLLGLVASSAFGAPSPKPKANYPLNLYKKALQETESNSQQQQFNTGRSSNYFGSDYNQYLSQSGSAFNFPNQPFQFGRAAGEPTLGGNSAPLGLTVDFDSSFGSFPLSKRNELTSEQRKVLIPVFDSLLRVMESNRPNVQDVNTLMKAVRTLLKTVPEQPLPNLRQYGFDVDALRTSMGIDLETLKSVALPATGDIAITENGQDKIVTTFGTFPLEPLMTKAEREQFLPVVRSFAKLLRQDFLDPSKTEELLNQVRKLDSWNLFPFSVRPSNEPRRKTGSGTTFNLGALGSLIGGLVNSQMFNSFA